MRRFLPFVLCCLIYQCTLAQEAGYHISGLLKGYDQDTIFLGHYYGDKQYLIDTVAVTDDRFVFADVTPLKPGVYLIVMPPDNRFFHLVINESQSPFSLEADFKAIEATITFEGSPDNALFYQNTRFIAQKRKEVTELNARLEQTAGEAAQQEIRNRLEGINEEVMAYQATLVAEHPNSMTSKLIESGFRVDIPEFTEGTKEEIQTKQYLHYKRHYFDHIDLGDNRLIRTPKHVLFDKVNYYLEKLTPQHPDSIILSMDFLLERLEPAEESYKYFLIKFLNDYAGSKIVGMDAVYVHLAEKYYSQGKAPWVEEAQLKKIVANARDIKPTLIGQTAPNFRVQRRDGTDITLHEIESPYTVLVFWAHDCGHCKDAMPELAEFYEEYRSKGIEVMSVCTKLNDEEPGCWKFVDEKEIGDWINASDKNGGHSYMHSLYNIKQTPKLFVLDAEKKIVSKELNAEQLGEFFDHIIEKPESEDGR